MIDRQIKKCITCPRKENPSPYGSEWIYCNISKQMLHVTVLRCYRQRYRRQVENIRNHIIYLLDTGHQQQEIAQLIGISENYIKEIDCEFRTKN